MSQHQKPVFFDPKGNRNKNFGRIIAATSLIILVLLVVFVVSISIFSPQLPNITLKPNNHTDDASNQGTPDWANEQKQDDKPKTPVREKTRFVTERKDANIVKTNFIEPNLAPTKPLSIGFYVNWDDTSYASLKRNLSQLDWVVPEWIRLQDGDNPLITDFDQKALDLIQKEKPTTPIIPLVQNYTNEEWDSGVLARNVKDEASRQKLVDNLLKTVRENKFGGICIDLEEVPASSQKNLFEFMKLLHKTFHDNNLIVSQAVPFDNPDWDYKAYAENTDFLMLMAYDQHWSTSAPGAIAAQDWFEQTLTKRMKDLSPSKTIVCIGNYGYDWSNKRKEAEDISFQEAVLASRDSEAKIKFDAATKNPYFSYDEDDGSKHTVWFLDAVTAHNEIQFSRKFNAAGFALWRLGAEDPSLWNIFGSDKFANPDVNALNTIRYGYDIDFEGTGEILNVSSEPSDGARDLVLNDENGSINSENYTAIPSTYVIQRTGDKAGLVALTFDDGPDVTWTPQILDELKKENVPATFFIVGENGQAYPDLIKRIVAEGHDIGNHSYSHPNMGEMPDAINEVELNTTQRLIESLTGRSTTLLRPPYFGDAEPQTADEVEPIVLGKKLGYITVGLRVDPDDWQRPGADVIVQKTVEGITTKSNDSDVRGNIVLLHDAGGDRSQTLAALPQIIEKLRAQGYKFVTVSELAGLPQTATMPFVPQEQQGFVKTNEMTFGAFAWFGWLLKILFMSGVILGVGRVVTFAILATLAKSRNSKSEAQFLSNSDLESEKQNHKSEVQMVSVIVPAYNEERVIVKTINSLLTSDYPNFEIIVVDDGSPDNTSVVVKANFEDESRVQLFTKENGGKGAALEFGLEHAKGEIIIGLDADTLFIPHTISALVDRFRDEKVGAVAGNAKVGNRINMITRWQALEYITAQNLDRRVLASLNAIMVVPGAVGAWRREALESAGGFGSNTLAEDQDLTIKVRMLGYKIAFANNAIAWTEAPDNFKGLSKQRFRWSYGTLQCLWKHGNALFNPKYGALGFVAMPSVWLFQIFFQMVSPLMDAMMVWTLIAHIIERVEHPNEFDPTKLENVAFYYILFLVVDMAAASLGFLFERNEDWKLLIWLPLQRFGYRQVMYFVMVKSVTTAIRGAIVGWNKIERKDTVRARI